MYAQDTGSALMLIIVLVAIALILTVGRAIIMWWLGTAEIVQQQKEIIRLLTIIAGETPQATQNPAKPTNPAYALQSGQSPKQSH